MSKLFQDLLFPPSFFQVPKFWFRYCSEHKPFVLPALFSAPLHCVPCPRRLNSIRHISRASAPSVLVWFGQWEAPAETGKHKNIGALAPLTPSPLPLKLRVLLTTHYCFQHTVFHMILLPGSLPSFFGFRISNGSTVALPKFLCEALWFYCTASLSCLLNWKQKPIHLTSNYPNLMCDFWSSYGLRQMQVSTVCSCRPLTLGKYFVTFNTQYGSSLVKWEHFILLGHRSWLGWEC